MSNLEAFLSRLKSEPSTVEFTEVMAIIDEHYEFTPTAFTNGSQQNAANENNGSCKVFAFARRHELSEAEALSCFGSYYRKDVLENPEGQDHQNIRNFMETGWGGIQFEAEPLSQKS